MTRVRTRRSPWTRSRDTAIAVSITAAVVLATGLVWVTSDSAATEHVTAAEARPSPQTPETPPASVSELWRAQSPITTAPVTAEGIVATAHDGAVVGRDAMTGEPHWRYERDIPLCAVAAEWSVFTAAYREQYGCSEVTQLGAGTGERTAQRNGDAELGAQLISDGSHMVTTGTSLLNVWSQDLVRTMEYGDVPAPINSGNQPRPDCHYGSIAMAHDNIGIVERCPNEDADRLTVIKTTHHDDDDDEARSEEPDEVFSEVLGGRSAQIVALSDEEPGLTATANGEHEELVIHGPDGQRQAGYELELPDKDLVEDPAGGVVTTSRTEEGVYWFTGSRTIALAEPDLAPRWTLPDTLGPPAALAGELLVPIDGGLAVLEEETGEAQRTIPVDRGDYSGPVHLATSGSVLLEQRGDELVALQGQS